MKTENNIYDCICIWVYLLKKYFQTAVSENYVNEDLLILNFIVFNIGCKTVRTSKNQIWDLLLIIILIRNNVLHYCTMLFTA